MDVQSTQNGCVAPPVRPSGRILRRLTLLAALTSLASLAAQDCALQILAPTGLPNRSRAGKSVSLSDGRLLIDAPNGGLGLVYRRDGDDWVLEGRLSRPSNSVARGELDGNHALFGARGSAPRAYRLVDGRWSPAGTLVPPRSTGGSYGQTIALGDGFAMVGEVEVELVDIFRFDEVDGWVHETTISHIDGPEGAFGFFLAIEGHVGLIGAPGSGRAFVVRRRDDESVWEHEATLESSDGCAAFGAGLDIQGDVAVVGDAAEFTNNPCGVLHVFRRTGQVWKLEQVLAPDGLPSGARAGSDVAIDGDTIVGGGSSFSPPSGMATAWTRQDGVWVETFRLEAPGNWDGYAEGVAVEGDLVAIGSKQEARVFLPRLVPGLEPTLTIEPAPGGDSSAFRFDGSRSIVPDGVEISEWRWDFGDGIESVGGATVEHTYDTPGRYSVSMSVVTAGGVCRHVSANVTAACRPGDTGSWKAQDIGEPSFPGAARSLDTAGAFEVCVGGAGLAGRSDEAYFAYREFNGDFVATLRVDELSDATRQAFVGLMLRADLSPGATFAAAALRNTSGLVPAQKFAWFRRQAAGQSARSTNGDSGRPPETWVRLARQDAEVVAASSSDGEDWKELGRAEIELGDSVLLGVVAAGHDTSPETPFTATTARVSSFAVELADGVRFRRGHVNADSTADLSDAVGILATLFFGGDPFTCEDAADVNDSGEVDISDVLALLGHLFLRSDALPVPFEDCGVDATEDELGCETSPEVCSI